MPLSGHGATGPDGGDQSSVMSVKVLVVLDEPSITSLLILTFFHPMIPMILISPIISSVLSTRHITLLSLNITGCV